MTTTTAPGPGVLQLGLGWFPEAHGGAENIFFHLVNRLPEQGFRVRGLVLGSARVAAATGGRVAAFAAPAEPLARRMAAAREGVRRVVRTEAPDLVASHFALNTAPALADLGGRPLVVHFHGPWALESAAEGAGRMAVRLKFSIERLVYGRAARFVVLSRAFHDILAREYQVPEDRISRVAGGVDADRYALSESRAQARERLGWPKDRPIVVTVRRLVRRMGLHQLLDAMVSVKARVPDVLLLIAGKGPEATALDARIQELGLSDNVRLLGFVADEDLPYAYRAADLSVIPSQALEGFGLTTLESLAAGTPVLVTPVGGMPDIVEDLSPDLILSGTAPAALAAGLTEALEGRRNLPSDDACRAFVRERYDWPVIAGRIADVYRAALR